MLGGIELQTDGLADVCGAFPVRHPGRPDGVGGLPVYCLTTGTNRTGLIAVLLLPAIPILALGGVIATATRRSFAAGRGQPSGLTGPCVKTNLRAWLAAGVIGASGVLAKYSFLAFPAVGRAVLAFECLAPQSAQASRLLVDVDAHRWRRASADRRLERAARLGWGQSTGRSRGAFFPSDMGEHLPGLELSGRGSPRTGRDLVDRRTRRPHADFYTTRSIWNPFVLRRQSGHTRIDSSPTNRTGVLYLVCLWGVLWCACLAASVLGETEANWMVPGYIALVVLIAARVDRALAPGARKPVLTSRLGASRVASGRRSPSSGMVLSRHCSLGPCPDESLGGPVSAL